MGLRADGFRFARVKANDYRWIHPAEMQVGYIDCTDMADDEFTALVRNDHDRLLALQLSEEGAQA